MSTTKFFRTPFATTGDKVAIPDDVQPSGAMSYAEGFGVDYERDPATDPLAKRIPRDETNQYLFDITANVRQYQVAGFPEWVTAAQNNGVALAYPLNAYVRHNGGGTWQVYAAKVDGAVLEPGVGAGWAAQWTVSLPVDATSLKATQVETDQGTGTGLTGAVEIVKSAREGKWNNMGTGVWDGVAPGQLNLTVPGGAAYNVIPGSTIAFAVPTANTVAGVTIKPGGPPFGAGGLQNQDGSIIAIGDLQPGYYYHATVSVNGAFWRLHEATTSVLARFASAGDGSIFGYLATNTAGNLNTHITFSTGNCRDSTNQRNIPRTAPMTKALNAQWVIGSGNGGRDQAAAPAANETWHAFAILNDATQGTDVLYSRSLAAPTMPGGWTHFRRIFSFILDASAVIRQFTHTGDYVALKVRGQEWAVTTNAVNAPGTLRDLGCPKGLKLLVRFYYTSTSVGGSAADPAFSGMFDPDTPAIALPGTTAWATIRVSWGGNANLRYQQRLDECWTNTNAQIYTASNDTGDTIAGGVLGWWDYRGRFF